MCWPGATSLPGRDDGIDVAVAEVADPDEAAAAGRRRERHRPSFDREDTVRSSRRRAAFRPVVANGDVDAVVVDRPALGIRPRVEEGSANRVLPVLRPDGPAPEGVVVDLRNLELPRRRHALAL